MKLIRTVKIKLDVKKSELLPTFHAYTKAFNEVCQVGYNDRDFNGISLHHKTYYRLRKELELPAGLTISSRVKATEALKSIKKVKNTSCPKSKLNSIRYEQKNYSLNFYCNEISILTISGRMKIKFFLSPNFIRYLDWKRKSAELFIRGNKVFLNICFEKDIEDIQSNDNYVGIDRGMNNLAVTSTKQFYGGGELKQKSIKINKLRQNLQKCGSKSAKRHLRRISKKENGFRTQTNHIISKKIINDILAGSIVILEDLSGIRNKNRGRKQNKEIHSWSYYQLEQFLIYKGLEKGIKIVKVDSRYTSQKCSKCGETRKSNRNGCRFVCKSCGYQLNADLNAAQNIKQNYLDSISYLDRADVNQPIVL